MSLRASVVFRFLCTESADPDLGNPLLLMWPEAAIHSGGQDPIFLCWLATALDHQICPHLPTPPPVPHHHHHLGRSGLGGALSWLECSLQENMFPFNVIPQAHELLVGGELTGRCPSHFTQENTSASPCLPRQQRIRICQSSGNQKLALFSSILKKSCLCPNPSCLFWPRNTPKYQQPPPRSSAPSLSFGVLCSPGGSCCPVSPSACMEASVISAAREIALLDGSGNLEKASS